MRILWYTNTPSLANCQNDMERLRTNYVKCIEVISFVIFPLMIFLSFVARPLFLVLFGSNWIDAIPLFQLLCLGYAMDIFSNMSLQLIQVMGRTAYTLKLEIFKKPIYAVVIAVSIYWGLKGIVVGHAFYCFVAAMINLSVVKTLLQYNYIKQVIDIFKYALMAVAVIAPVSYILSLIVSNNILFLGICTILSILFYLLLGMMFRVSVMTFMYNFLKRK